MKLFQTAACLGGAIISMVESSLQGLILPRRPQTFFSKGERRSDIFNQFHQSSQSQPSSHERGKDFHDPRLPVIGVKTASSPASSKLSFSDKESKSRVTQSDYSVRSTAVNDATDPGIWRLKPHDDLFEVAYKLSRVKHRASRSGDTRQLESTA